MRKYCPPQVDLRVYCPPVYSQGTIGSCTANAIAAAIQFEQARQHSPRLFMPSRLFIYYNERVIENTVDLDCGAQLQSGLKAVAMTGFCDEVLWPYKAAAFRDKPSQACYDQAALQKGVFYQSLVQDLHHMEACLAEGRPFLFGLTAYETFEGAGVAQTGQLQMPREEEHKLGGHAVMAVGYDQSRRHLLVRNSWVQEWGQHGYFTVPYDYIATPGLATDFWIVSLTGGIQEDEASGISATFSATSFGSATSSTERLTSASC